MGLHLIKTEDELRHRSGQRCLNDELGAEGRSESSGGAFSNYFLRQSCQQHAVYTLPRGPDDWYHGLYKCVRFRYQVTRSYFVQRYGPRHPNTAAQALRYHLNGNSRMAQAA